jgi:hypothetical protein
VSPSTFGGHTEWHHVTKKQARQPGDLNSRVHSFVSQLVISSMSLAVRENKTAVARAHVLAVTRSLPVTIEPTRRCDQETVMVDLLEL